MGARTIILNESRQGVAVSLSRLGREVQATVKPGAYTVREVDAAKARGVAYLEAEDGEWYCVERAGLGIDEDEG